MAFILPIEEPWTSQPQEAVGIDWSNPIASKMSACAVPTNGVVLAFGRKYVEKFGTQTGSGIKIKVGALGYGVDGSAVTTDVIRLHTTASATNTAWEEPVQAATFLAFCVRFGNNKNGNAPIFGNQSAVHAPYSPWAIVDRGGTGGFGVECSAGGTVRTLDIAAGLSNNTPMVLVGRYDGAKLESFRDGVKSSGSTACSGSLVYPTSQRGPAIGNFYDYTVSGRSFNGQTYLVAVWPIALSDVEIKNLSGNPWQLFAP